MSEPTASLPVTHVASRSRKLFYPRPLRLTLLLLVACVVVVFALSSVAAAAASVIASRPIAGVASNEVIVSDQPPSQVGLQTYPSLHSINTADVSALSNIGYVPDAIAVAPSVTVPESVISGYRSVRADTIGSTGAFATAAGYTLHLGQFLSDQDVNLTQPVVVLGYTVAQELYGSVNPIGQTLTIGGMPFRVIGVLNARGFSGTTNLDDVVVAPITTIWSTLLRLQGNPIDQVILRAAKPQQARLVAQEATSVLLQQQGVSDPANADFSVLTHQTLAAAILAPAKTLELSFRTFAVLIFLLAVVFIVAVTKSLHRFNREPTGGLVGLIAELVLYVFVGAVVGAGLVYLLAPHLGILSPGFPNVGVSVNNLEVGLFGGFALPVVSMLPVAFVRRSGRHSS